MPFRSDERRTHFDFESHNRESSKYEISHLNDYSKESKTLFKCKAADTTSDLPFQFVFRFLGQKTHMLEENAQEIVLKAINTLQ